MRNICSGRLGRPCDGLMRFEMCKFCCTYRPSITFDNWTATISQANFTFSTKWLNNSLIFVPHEFPEGKMWVRSDWRCRGTSEFTAHVCDRRVTVLEVAWKALRTRRTPKRQDVLQPCQLVVGFSPNKYPNQLDQLYHSPIRSRYCAEFHVVELFTDQSYLDWVLS